MKTAGWWKKNRMSDFLNIKKNAKLFQFIPLRVDKKIENTEK